MVSIVEFPKSILLFYLFISERLLWHSLYCIKHYRNKWLDLICKTFSCGIHLSVSDYQKRKKKSGDLILFISCWSQRVHSPFIEQLTSKQRGSTSEWSRRPPWGAPVQWGKQGWQKQWLQLLRDIAEWSEWETLVSGECAVEREWKRRTLAHVRHILHLINTIMLTAAALRSDVCMETQGCSSQWA